ncbi:MAG: hypothetical protein ACJA2G_002889 [Cognaticolwellia sp.]|jgi:hypothetical protein
MIIKLIININTIKTKTGKLSKANQDELNGKSSGGLSEEFSEELDSEFIVKPNTVNINSY